MKSNQMSRAIVLLIFLLSLLPVNIVNASPAKQTTPPANFFQLPWDQGIAWYAIDGIDNGSKRPLSSSHNYKVGGAIDFAPKKYMFRGEDTSNYWVAAAGPGTVVGLSTCHVIIDHGNGWITQYQFLAKVQVNLGDHVERNQRLGIIADGIRYPFCLGSTEPDIPHLHFMLRPTLIGATLAGWNINYYSFFSSTTFTKNNITVGLYQPLMNLFDAVPTDTPTPTPTATEPTPTEITPTPTGPYVSTSADPLNINVGDTALVTVKLNNVPAEGYTSTEITCPYNPSLLEVSNIAVADVFGTDPATAINGPQNGSFIVAIAGSHGNKAAADGTAFTFNVKGLFSGQTNLECTARVSSGNSQLTDIDSLGTLLTVLGESSTSTPTATSTQVVPSATPTIPSSLCDKAEFVADINIPPGTVMNPGAMFTKTWRLKNIGSCAWTTSYQMVFFNGDQMGAVAFNNFSQTVEVGETVDISINMTAPLANGSYRGYWMFRNANGALFGVGDQGNQPWFVDIIVSDSLSTPTSTAIPTPSGDWLLYRNIKYGFQFLYPPQGTVVSGGNDNFTRINLPFTLGTNLTEKYLEMVVAENVNPCQSPLATQSMLETSETVVIAGITFLKQTGQDGTAGHINKWTAYSTSRDNACVSLDFILRAANPGVFSTPPPLYDETAESLVFPQIVSTYAWLAQPPTATPTTTLDGALAGQVFAAKPVTITLYNSDSSIAGTVAANPDGSFTLTAPAGTYAAVASSSGFLNVQAVVNIKSNFVLTLPPVYLPAGDIDGNNVIDQFDALTIGMNYNAAEPSVADLNNDGIINVLDLEALAANYRKTGPIAW